MENSNKSSRIKFSELQHLLREPMRLCRWTGFFSVDGLSESTISSIRCSIKFPYIFFHIASILGQFITTALSLITFCKNTCSLLTSSYLLFYSTGLITAMLIVNLSKNWARLLRNTSEIETSLVGIRRPHNSWKYKSIAYIIMSLAVVEHILSIMSNIHKAMSELNESEINDKVLERYFTGSMPFILNMSFYSLWKAVPFMIANLQATFLWNVTDVMIMCISIYLTSYLQDLNKIIYENQISKSVPWEDIRMHYSQLVALVKEVDSRFCHLVLLSFFTNLFFISLQLFNALNALHLIYYIYSFVFLMARASVMCLLAANVHKAAQEPLFVVRYVPASEYTLVIQRFIRQIRYTTTALSGVYFYVTRSTLLKAVGTLLTYELVLLQFNLEIVGATTRRRNLTWND
nr:gustatory receptor 8 [Papilio glaucus]